MQAHLLIYDIPQSLPYPNPSGRLRRFGARVNLSCWVVPANAIPYVLLNEFTARGVTWHMVKFDAAEGEKLAKMVRESLTADLKAAISRARKAADRVARKMERISGTYSERMEARAAYLVEARAISKKLGKLITDLRHASRAFGFTDNDGISSGEAMSAMGVLRATIDHRAALYVRGIAELQKLPSRDSRAMAETLKTNPSALPMAADLLQDHDHPMGVEILETFAE